MLPQTSYIFDGLWRCLCPSIDAVLLAKAASGSFRRPSRPPAVRRFHTSRRTHGHHHPQNVALPPTTVDDLIKLGGNDPNHRTLHDAPTETIYEALTELRRRQSQQNKIKLLVRHLVEVRDEQPNVSLYDALVTTSWDTGGSAVILDAVMKDMKKSGITPTVGFYHTALRVGETLSFYPLESRSRESCTPPMKGSTDSGPISYLLFIPTMCRGMISYSTWRSMMSPSTPRDDVVSP
jgi:hypothetical protein